MSTVIATVRASPARYEIDFNACDAYLSQCFEKQRLRTSVKIASFAQFTPAKQQHTQTHGTFKRKIQLHKYLRDKYESMSSVQRQQLHELQHNAVFQNGSNPETERNRG